MEREKPTQCMQNAYGFLLVLANGDNGTVDNTFAHLRLLSTDEDFMVRARIIFRVSETAVKVPGFGLLTTAASGRFPLGTVWGLHERHVVTWTPRATLDDKIHFFNVATALINGVENMLR